MFTCILVGTWQRFDGMNQSVRVQIKNDNIGMLPKLTWDSAKLRALEILPCVAANVRSEAVSDKMYTGDVEPLGAVLKNTLNSVPFKILFIASYTCTVHACICMDSSMINHGGMKVSGVWTTAQMKSCSYSLKMSSIYLKTKLKLVISCIVNFFNFDKYSGKFRVIR